MHPGFAHHGFMARPMFVHRPVFAHRPFFVHRPFVRRPFFVRRHHRFGPAFAAGFVGGAALGSLGYASYGYPYYGEDCYVVRRRIVNPWGYVVVRRALVCG
jgi:hypothetical protein